MDGLSRFWYIFRVLPNPERNWVKAVLWLLRRFFFTGCTTVGGVWMIGFCDWVQRACWTACSYSSIGVILLVRCANIFGRNLGSWARKLYKYCMRWMGRVEGIRQILSANHIQAVTDWEKLRLNK